MRGQCTWSMVLGICSAPSAARSQCTSGRERESHPKYAELGLRDWCIQRRGKTQSEHAARFGRRDDAVVPQPRRGVIGVAFGVILLADRLFELFFLDLRPFLAFGLDIVPAHSRERRGRLF